MCQPSSHRSTNDVLRFSVVGLLCLVVSALPVGVDYRGLLLGASMPGALMASWIAGGLGVYGVARYPSRRMLFATIVAVSSAALCGWRFWRLVMSS